MSIELDHAELLNSDIQEILAIYRSLPPENKALVRRFFKIGKHLPQGVLQDFCEQVSRLPDDGKAATAFEAFVQHWESERVRMAAFNH